MPSEYKREIVNFFTDNKTIVICDVLKGRGGLCADWFLVTRKNNETKESHTT